MDDARPPEPPAAAQSLRPAELDLERYRHFLDGEDLTEAQANEIMRALWEIMIQFVDMGFDASFVPRFFGESSENPGERDSSVVSLNQSENCNEDKERGP